MNRNFRIGVIATVYYPASHADVIVSRWLEPRPSDSEWGWGVPQSRIASLYVEQFPPHDMRDFALEEVKSNHSPSEIDMARCMAERHELPLCDSVRDALTLGGDTLAVDAVLLIGEHGEYPFNSLYQKLYPRKELFDAIVSVFRETGQVVPLFCDKHLSWNSDWAREMVATAQTMGIPFRAGSSLPLVGLNPPVPNLAGTALAEFVGLCYVGPEVYGFHSLELMQSLIEKRAGGEAGIRRITAYVGDGVERAMAQGIWSQDLFEMALNATESKRQGDWQSNCRGVTTYEGATSPIAFALEHNDGFRSAHIMLEGHLQDFTAALRLQDGTVFSGRCASGDESSFYGHFATLNAHIEQLFLTGQSPTPQERTLLTTLTTAACMKALQIPGQPLDIVGDETCTY
ncbi:MAG: hypothetical protein NT023_23165 [Armatimonadetes bacterium]|nr:hypothetical protein [Armatimonadota bacterium]